MSDNTTDDFDFGINPNNHVEVEKELRNKINDLHVLVDTLQANLRTAEAIITKYEPACQLISTPSYKWCINWKQ